MEVINKHVAKSEKSELVNTFKEVKRHHKEFGFIYQILKRSLTERKIDKDNLSLD